MSDDLIVAKCQHCGEENKLLPGVANEASDFSLGQYCWTCANKCKRCWTSKIAWSNGEVYCVPCTIHKQSFMRVMLLGIFLTVILMLRYWYW